MEKDHLEILLEDIQSKFELVLEGHESLRKEIREARDESNEKHEHTAFLLKALNDKIDTGDAKLDKKIDSLDTKLSKRIDEVEDKLTRKIDDVDNKLTRKIDDVNNKLTRKIDDVDTKLSKRIDEVEDRLAKKIDAVAEDLAAHRADTESHRKSYLVSENRD